MICPECQAVNPDTQRFCGECGTRLTLFSEIPASPTKTLETPIKGLIRGSFIAGRYEVLEQLGRGGMGEVYRVQDTKLEEEMALKLLKPEIASDESMTERFRNELKLARKISHKNVCRMHDFHEEGKTPFITMEYVAGETLKDRVKRLGKIHEHEAIKIAKQVCEGLAEAHRLGIVHRDLKPQNIILNEKGENKIMDFGIARSIEAPGVTRTGMIIGTPDYMSPEQAEGEEADKRSDIYALGVILYEMVTGSVPFGGDTALSVALKHKAQLPQNPRKLNPEISESLSRLILVCMEKDRSRRYQTAENLLADLRNIEEGFPLGTKIRPRRGTFVADLIRKKLFIPTLVVALAVIAAVIWLIFLQKGIVSLEPAKPSIAVLPFVDLSPKNDLEYLCDGLADELINRLTKVERIKVPARTSSFSFKGKDLDIQEIGKKLNVETILEGSIKKLEGKLRITVQLVKILDGTTLWSDRYEQDEDNIFVIQDGISLSILNSLKIKLLGGEKENFVKRYTENAGAYNFYLRGRFFYNKWTSEGFLKAIDYYEQAIDLDSRFALAYSGLTLCYINYTVLKVLPAKEALLEAKEIALRALELDNNLAEAHTSIAFLKAFLDGDLHAADAGFKRAIDLNPRSATVHHAYSWYLDFMGRHDESIAELKQTLKLDPISLIVNTHLGRAYYFARRYDKAIEQLLITLDLDHSFFPTYGWLILAYQQKGIYEEAITTYQKYTILLSESQKFPLALRKANELKEAYLESGEKGYWEWMLDLDEEYLRVDQILDYYWKAGISSIAGNNYRAFELLQKSYKDPFSPLNMLETVSMLDNFLKIEPMFSSFRSDQRYLGWLKKIVRED